MPSLEKPSADNITWNSSHNVQVKISFISYLSRVWPNVKVDLFLTYIA